MAKKKKAAKSTTFIIQETTVTVGKTATINFNIDGERVALKVPEATRAYFREQFVRANPTAAQRNRWTTLNALVRAAYQAGKKAAE